MNRFAHCPDPKALEKVYYLMMPRFATSDDSQIRKQRKDDFIATLPSSVKSPTEFVNMLDKAREIYTENPCGDDSSTSIYCSIRATLFYQQKNQYHKSNPIGFPKDICISLDDYTRQITKDLIYPEVARIFLLHNGVNVKINEFMEKNLDNIELYETLRKKYAVATLRINLLNLLLDKHQWTVNNALQERWHRNVNVIAAAKPIALYINVQSWHALFEPETIGEVSFICLTSEQQLKDEGQEMEHCAGGYSDKCLRGSTHIVKVRSTSGRSSTLELSLNIDSNGNEQVEVIQNRTVRNQMVSKEILDATNLLLTKINENSIKLNKLRGELITPEKIPHQLRNEYYPYDFGDEEVQETIYQAYKNTKTLPAFMMVKNFKELVSTKEIKSLIQKTLMHDFGIISIEDNHEIPEEHQPLMNY